MRHERWLNGTAWYVSLLLGQASALLGLTIALGWTLAMVLVVPTKAAGWAMGPRLLLPIEPPLIGLALGCAGYVIGRYTRQPITRYSVAGIVFNAIPLAQAVNLAILRHAQ